MRRLRMPSKAWISFGKTVVASGIVATGIGSVIVKNSEEETPYSGRKRLVLHSGEDELRKITDELWKKQQIEFKDKILPPTHDAVKTCVRTWKNVLKGVPESKDWDWEVVVIDAEEIINASCAHGGKVTIYTGLFRITPDESSLAAVLAHECAHALALHVLEANTKTVIVSALMDMMNYLGFGSLFQFIFGGTSFLYIMMTQPAHSRIVEQEADYIGARLLAQGCIYSPMSMMKIASRLGAVGKIHGGGVEKASYFDSHPTGEARVAALKAVLPSMLAEQRARCPSMEQFQRGR